MVEKNEKKMFNWKILFLYVRQGDTFIKVSWVDILYVESMQNYTKLHFKEKIYCNPSNNESY